MDLIYLSKTGNSKRFSKKVENLFSNVYDMLSIEKANSDFILLTPTFGFGEVPQETKKFIKENKNYCKGIISAGHKNWGNLFAVAGEKISRKYNIPLIMKIELSGEQKDYKLLEDFLSDQKSH